MTKIKTSKTTKAKTPKTNKAKASKMTELKTSEEKLSVTHLTSKQLAERYNMHPNSVADWRVDGYGPKFLKLGKNVLYPVVEVEKWEKEQLKRSTSEY
jgi:hypothetical protein